MNVTKIGGSIARHSSPLLDELAETPPAVLVHGFGPQTTQRARQEDVELRWITSPDEVRSRYTDEDVLDVMRRAAGDVARELTRELDARDAPVRHLLGTEILEAEAKPALRHEREDGRTVVVRGNRSGRVTAVDAGPVEAALESRDLPLVTPLAADDEGLVSVDADRAAAALAGALGADELVLLTDVERVRDADGQPIEHLTPEQAGDLVDEGVAAGGMLRKVVAAGEAIESGVDRVLVADGRHARPIERARKGHATVIAREGSA